MQCQVYHREDYGGFWRRSFAYGIDALLLTLLCATAGLALRGIPELVVQSVISLSYLIGLKVRSGATPGYRLLDLKLVATTGSAVTLAQVVVRLLVSIVSTLAIGLGFIWVAIDENKQAWHDKVAGTYVIRAGARPIGVREVPQRGLIRYGLLASLVSVAGVLLAGLVIGVMYGLKSSDVYTEALGRVKTSEEVKKQLGSPIDEGFWVTGTIERRGKDGTANLSLPIAGPKGAATVRVVAFKFVGR